MSVSAGIVLQALIFFQLSFKLISMSSHSLKVDFLVWMQFAWGLLRPTYKVKIAFMLPGSCHARMAPALQRPLLSSLNPYFPHCKHNIAFLVPKSTALHCILQQ